MPEPLDLFFSIVFGAIGAGYLVYGKKSQSFFFILCGLLLISYTFVTSSTAEVIWYGVALLIIPFILDKLF